MRVIEHAENCVSGRVCAAPASPVQQLWSKPGNCFFWFVGGARWTACQIGVCSRFESCGREIGSAEKASRRWQILFLELE